MNVILRTKVNASIYCIMLMVAMHAYLGKIDNINQVETDHHRTMSTQYVAPMANYLRGLFGISELDAFALAWSGLTQTGAYANVLEFDMGGITYSKSNIIQAAAKYKGRGPSGNLLSGKELCDN